ncbi:MAG TPA: hypothetical protein DCX60_04825 [Phycisphaerales bacterium]|nr:hypothetical protein [Phycisphaerales bacterium]
MNTHTLTTSLITCSLGLGLAGSLAADVTTAYYNSGSDYGYHLSQMPDFDQRRNGLATTSTGSPGGMYCVPTSCTDLLAYMASHGEPALGPVFADWESQVDYADVTDFIDDLGDDMGTTGTGGTSGSPAYVAMFNRVVWPSGMRYLVGHEYRTRSNVVTLREMAKTGMDLDAIQTVCYGFYNPIGTLWGDTVIQRNGGHCMTFTGAERSGSDRRLWANDPDDSANTATQSTFGADDWSAPWVGNLRVASNMVAALFTPTQGMNRIMRGDSDTLRLIDSRIVIFPVGCTTWGDWEGDSTPLFTHTWSLREQKLSLNVEHLPFQIENVLQMPMGDVILVERATERFARLWRKNQETNGFKPIEIGDEEGPDFLDFAISKNLGILALASNGTLYECPGDSEAIINPDSMHPVLEGLQGFDRLSADDQSGMICLVRSTDGLIMISDRYGEKIDIYDLRDMKTILGSASPRFRDFNRDGTPEILFSGVDSQGRASVTLFDPERSSNGNLFMKDVTQDFMGDCSGACEIRGLDIDTVGNVLINRDGAIRSYRCDIDAQGMYRFLSIRGSNDQPVFEDLQVRNGLNVARCFTNYDERIHNQEGWKNVEEDAECEDCGPEGDINGDGKVNGEDLAILLGAWDSTDPRADLNDDGTVGGPDLAILLGGFDA